ncbi:MAG: hypothetical protein CR990_00360 [Desulfococcus sp.]|nr:MAG: hypothetical protein CR990_00360 [Desulfococcus sp.]
MINGEKRSTVRLQFGQYSGTKSVSAVHQPLFFAPEHGTPPDFPSNHAAGGTRFRRYSMKKSSRSFRFPMIISLLAAMILSPGLSSAADSPFIGSSVAFDDGYAAAGAPGANSTGQVFVYQKNGSTLTPRATLAHDDLEAGDLFGSSLDMSGEYLIIGAPGVHRALNTSQDVEGGAALIYRRSSPASWSVTTDGSEAFLLSSDGLNAAGDQFGSATAILSAGSGSAWAVVGAPMDASSNTDTGSVRFYTVTGNSWEAKSAKQYPSDLTMQSYFGTALAMTSHTVNAETKCWTVVGAPYADGKGAVYIYRLDGDEWVQTQKLTITQGPASGDQFGAAVAAAGDWIFAAAPKRHTNGVSDSGCVYPYQYDAATDTFVAKPAITGKKKADPNDENSAIIDDVVAGARFGSAVDADGDRLIVGADEYGDGGAAYVYQYINNAWTLVQRWVQTEQDGAFFGAAVAIDAGTGGVYDTFVGAPESDSGTGDVQHGNNASTGNDFNQFPVISHIDDVQFPVGAEDASVSFTVVDEDLSDNDPSTNISVFITVNGTQQSSPPLTVSGNSYTYAIFTGTTSANPVPVTITVSDSDGQEAEESFTYMIYEPPVISGLDDNYHTPKNTPKEVEFQVTGDVSQTPAVEIANSLVVASAAVSGDSGSYTAALHPASNASGSSDITITVTNDAGYEATATFTLSVGGLEIVRADSPVSAKEEEESEFITITVKNNKDGNVTLSAPADPSGYGYTGLPLTKFVSANTETDFSFRVTPPDNPPASQDIEMSFTYTDGGMDIVVTQTIRLDIEPVNDPPVITDIKNAGTPLSGTPPEYNHTMMEGDSASLTVVIDDPDPADDPSELTVSVQSNREDILPSENITPTGFTENRNLSIQPLPNAFGEVQIEVTVTDSDGAEGTAYIDLTITPTNDPPEIAEIASPQTMNEDETKNITLTVTDPDGDDITLTVTSGDPAILPNDKPSGSPAYYHQATLSPNAAGIAEFIVPFTPEPNQHGNVTITVKANDSTATDTATFILEVEPVNDPPLIERINGVAVTDPSLNPYDSVEGADLALPVTISDPDGNLGALVLSAVTNREDLLEANGLTTTGYTATRILRIDLKENAAGEIPIALTLSDGEASDTVYFTVDAKEVPDAPVIAAVENQTTPEETGLTVPVTVSDVEGGEISLYYRSDTPDLIPNEGTAETINGTDYYPVGKQTVAAGEDASFNLPLTPKENQTGSAAITLIAQSPAPTDPAIISTSELVTFSLEVTPVNDLPVIYNVPASSGHTIDENGSLRIPDWEAVPAPLPEEFVKICDPDTTYLKLTLALADTEFETLFPQSGLNIILDADANGVDDEDFRSYTVFVTDLDSTNGGCNSKPIYLEMTPAQYESGGAAEIVLTVEDDQGGTASVSFQVIVNDENNAPIITGTPETNANVGHEYSFVPTADDPDDGDAVESFLVCLDTDDSGTCEDANDTMFGDSGWPAWLGFDTSTGALTGMPANADLTGPINPVTKILVGATDGDLTGYLPAFDIDIHKDNHPPVITAPGLQTMEEDGTHTIEFTVSDGDGDEVNLTIGTYDSNPDTTPLPPVYPLSEFKSLQILVNDAAQTYDPAVNPVPISIQTAAGVDTAVKLIVAPKENFNTDDFGSHLFFRLTAADVPDGAEATVRIIELEVTPESDSPEIIMNPETATGASFPEANESNSPFYYYFRCADAPDPLGVHNGCSDALLVSIADPDKEILTITTASDSESVEVKLYETGGTPGVSDTVLINAVSGPVGTPMALRLSPDPNFAGVVKVTITVNDSSEPPLTAERDLYFNITNANSAPEIVSVDVPTEPMEEEAVLEIPFTVREWDNTGDDLTLTAAETVLNSSPPGLSTLFSEISFTGAAVENNGAGLFQIKNLTQGEIVPANLRLAGETDVSGKAAIELCVEDNGGEKACRNFQITVNGVNDPPVLDPIPSPVAVNEDEKDFPVSISFTDIDGDNIDINATTGDESIIPQSSIRIQKEDSPGVWSAYTLPYTAAYDSSAGSYGNYRLEFDLVNNVTGTTTITVTINDQSSDPVTRTFNVTVTPTPDPPNIDWISPVTVTEDQSPPQTVPIFITEPDGGLVTLNIESANEAILPNNIFNINVTGPTGVVRSLTNNGIAGVDVELDLPQNVETELTMTLITAENAFTNPGDTVTVTLTADDGTIWTGDPAAQAKRIKEFALTVTPVSDPPTISVIPPQMVTFPTPSSPIQFKVHDTGETPDGDLFVTSSATPASRIKMDVTKISDAIRQLIITPLAPAPTNTTETINATLTVVDGDGTETSTNFKVFYQSSTARRPEFKTDISDMNVYEGDVKSFDFVVNYDLAAGEDLEVHASSGDHNVLPNDDIIITHRSSSGNDHTYRCTLTIPQNAAVSGTQKTVTVTLYANGDEASSSKSFDVLIDPKNVAPTVTAPTAVTLFENTSKSFQVEVLDEDGDDLWLYVEPPGSSAVITFNGITVGGSTLPVKLTNVTPGIKSVVTVTVTPETGQSTAGTPVELTIKVVDAFAEESPTVTTKVTVSASGSPTLYLTGKTVCPSDQVVERNEPVVLMLDVADPDDQAVMIQLSGTSDNQTVIADSGIVFRNDGNVVTSVQVAGSGTPEALELTVTPRAGQYGEAWITILATDPSGKNSSCTFLVTVREVLAGDVDASGTVTLSDAVLALQVLSGINAANTDFRADVNGDSRIGIEEAVYILRYAAGL